MMGELGSSEMLVIIYQTTWCHILEDSNLHSHHHKNLTSSLKVSSTHIQNYCGLNRIMSLIHVYCVFASHYHALDSVLVPC
jgi:hypothetical protein